MKKRDSNYYEKGQWLEGNPFNVSINGCGPHIWQRGKTIAVVPSCGYTAADGIMEFDSLADAKEWLKNRFETDSDEYIHEDIAAVARYISFVSRLESGAKVDCNGYTENMAAFMGVEFEGSQYD